MHGRTHERRNEGTKERTNERTNRRMNIRVEDLGGDFGDEEAVPPLQHRVMQKAQRVDKGVDVSADIGLD